MATVLIVIAILVFLIVAHEFGHFLTAKLFKVKVEEFGIGYPPRALTFGKWGGTEYTLNWLPFGGFVRLFGDSVGESDVQARGSLHAAKRHVQALILIAGVAMNALAAWLLFTSAFMIGTWQPVATPDGEQTRVFITAVVAGSPAQAAGLAAGDELLSVSDAKGNSPDLPLSPDTIVAFVSAHAGKVLTVTYVRGGETSQANMTPAQGVLASEAGQPALGVALVLAAQKSEGFIQAARDGAYETVATLGSVLSGLWQIAAGSVRGAPNLTDVAGPVGIVSYVGQAMRSGTGALLALAASISVNLVVINLIPIPALDGGRLLMLGIEALRGRKTRAVTVMLVNAIGITLIIVFMAAVTYHDIARLLH